MHDPDVLPATAPSRVRDRPTWLVSRAYVRSSALLNDAFDARGAGLRGYHYRLLSALDEWGPASQLGRQGVTKDTLKIGDRVIVTGNPGRTAEDHRIRMVNITRPSDGWKWGGDTD